MYICVCMYVYVIICVYACLFICKQFMCVCVFVCVFVYTIFKHDVSFREMHNQPTRFDVTKCKTSYDVIWLHKMT